MDSLQEPRIAVALAAFNGVAYLAPQLESILGQTGVSVTVFASVDPSSDGTEAWLQQRAAEEPRLRLLPPAGRFGCAAANFLRLLRDIDLHGFDALCFADQDDIWLADKLARACQQLRDSGAQGYSSNVTAFWPDGRQRLIDKAQPQRRWDHLFEAAGPGCTYVLAPALAAALQRVARDRQQELVPLNYHDWFVYAFARIQGHRWVIDPYPGVRYRQHTGNQVGANTGVQAFLRRAAKVRNGEALTQARLIASAAGLRRDHPVMRWLHQGRAGLLRLAFQARHCRRRRLEQVYFFVSCLLTAATGPQKGAHP